MTAEIEELQRQIEDVRLLAEDALDKFPIRSTTTPGAGKERHIHNLGKHPGGVIAARVFNSGAITIVTGTDTALTFDSERYDTDTIHSTSSNTGRLTATTAGKYDIGGNGQWAADPVNASIYIRLNGSTFIARSGLVADYRVMNISATYDLAVGDYVELVVFQGSGAGVNILATSNYSPEFWMSRVGAAGTVGGGVPGTDHGALTGLGDDDHSLYLLAAGSREGSTGGAQSFGSTGIKADVIAEDSAGAGVTADGALLKDGVLAVGDVAFDDGTSDPLQDADAAADGTENSVARKDHKHPKHHAKYLDSAAIAAVEGEATLDLTGDVTIDGAKSLKVDVISEKDAAAGVTIEGVLLKDDNVELEDNTKLLLGTGKDASIYYDTTDLILDPDVVGTGVVRVASADGEVRIGDVTAGTASTDAGIMLNGAGSFESAIFTEVGGEIFSYGINVPQMSSRDTDRVGAYFYLDIRTSVEQYGLRRYAKSGSTLVETFIIDLENGGLTLRSPDDGVAPCLAMRQENSGTHGWDWDIDTLTTGEMYLYGVIASTRVVEQMWDRVNHRVGIGTNVNPAAKLDITQSNASGAIPVLELDQDDIDDTFINLVGTSAADSSRSISSSTASAAAKFGAFRVEINGTTKWVRVYDSAV